MMAALDNPLPLAQGFPSGPIGDPSGEMDLDKTERIDHSSGEVPAPPLPFEARFRLDFEPGAREARHELCVPPGRTLQIEYMMARLRGGPALPPRGRVLLVVQTLAQGKESVHTFRFARPDLDSSRPDPGVFRKTTLYADARSRVEFVFMREAPEDARGVEMALFGALVSDVC